MKLDEVWVGFFFPKFPLVINPGNIKSRVCILLLIKTGKFVLAKLQYIVKPCIIVNVQLPTTGISDSPNSLSCNDEDNASRSRGLFWL